MAKIVPKTLPAKGKGKAGKTIAKTPQKLQSKPPQKPVQKILGKPQQKPQQKKQQKQTNVDPLALLAALGLGGKGKGPSGKTQPGSKPRGKNSDRLRKLENDKKVWVGGLSKDTTWKDLRDHFESAIKPKFGDIIVKRDGTATAVLAYDSTAEVSTVVAQLNGSKLKGKTIEVDTWEKPERPEGEKKKKAKGGKRPKQKSNPLAANLMKVLNLKLAKGSKAKENKTAAKLKTVDPSLKVWVGGLSPKTTWKSLEKHFATVAKPHLVDIMRKGRGVVSYKSDSDVSSAIAALNGSELDGKTLEVDVWTKPEKKPKSD